MPSAKFNLKTNDMEETRICKVCGKELPIDQFANVRNGHKMHTCKSCHGAKMCEGMRNMKPRKVKIGGG